MGGSESKSETNPLLFVSPPILKELAHLNLFDRLVSKRRIVSCDAYGDISKGSCTLIDRDKVKVAIKCLRFHLKEDIKRVCSRNLTVCMRKCFDTNSFSQLFEKEIYVWSKLKHENILDLIGYCIDNTTGTPMLVSEWMENGTAWEYMKLHPDADLLLLVGN